jgi:hypothetical protein
VEARVRGFFSSLSNGDLAGALAAYDPSNAAWRVEMSGWLSQYTDQGVSFDQVHVGTVSFRNGVGSTTASFLLDGSPQTEAFTAVRNGLDWYLQGPDPDRLGPLQGGRSRHFITFYYQWDAGDVARVAASGDGVFDGVMADFQVPPSDALHQQLYSLEVAPTASTMPGQVRDRLGATDLSTVYVRTPSIWTLPADGGLSAEAAPVIAHELTHVLAGNFDLTMPAWLTEGAATWEQERWTHGEQLAADRAVFHQMLTRGGSLPTLDGLSVEDPFGASGELSNIAYAESESLVAYMVQRWGRGALRQFMEGHGHGLTENQSSEKAFGLPLDALYQRWLAQVRSGETPF